jgi:hypothetical protein
MFCAMMISRGWKTRIVNQDRLSSSLNLKPKPPEYGDGMLIARPWYFVPGFKEINKD